MPDTLGYEAVVQMLRGAIAQVKANHETLSKLDSVGGDGDHGTTMVRAMEQIERVVSDGAADMSTLLHDAGWAVMGVDGGATGPLLGSLLMSMAEGAAEKDALDTAALTAIFEAGLAGVQKRTRAQLGDKTILDAFVPAVQALRGAAANGAAPLAALQQAAAAAAEGAAETKKLQARFGRAKNIGAESIGAQDPGATSMALLFKGFSEGAESNA